MIYIYTYVESSYDITLYIHMITPSFRYTNLYTDGMQMSVYIYVYMYVYIYQSTRALSVEAGVLQVCGVNRHMILHYIYI